MKKFEDLINKYKIKVIKNNGEKALGFYNGKPNATDVVFIKANKQEIIAFIQETERKIKQELAEKEASEIKVITSGWESHEIYIDTRKNINTQLKEYAIIYSNDCTLTSLKADFKKAVEKLEKENIQEKEKEEKIQAIFKKAYATNTEQILSVAKQGVETDTDYIINKTTIYAQPDGTTRANVSSC